MFNWLGGGRARCRPSIWVLLSFVRLADFAREQSKQHRDRNQQNEKEILDGHGAVEP
jgi:hypothetical protein